MNDIQRIDTVSGGQVAQTVNGDMVGGDKIINYTIHHQDDFDLKILKYKKETIDCPKHYINIDIGFDNIKNKGEIFSRIEYFVFNSNILQLQFNFILYFELNTTYLETELERFIFQNYFDYRREGIRKISYTKFDKLIEKLNNHIQNEKEINNRNEYQTVKEFFYRYYGNLLPYEEYSSKEFFEYLDKNDIDYISKDFRPQSIDDFFKYKMRHGSDDYWNWNLLYEDIRDYDFYVMCQFLYTEKGNSYKKDICGLKDFINDFKFKTSFCDEIDGCEPYSLHNICELKIWNRNDNNSSWWKDILDNPCVVKEQDRLDDEFEKFQTEEALSIM